MLVRQSRRMGWASSRLLHTLFYKLEFISCMWLLNELTLWAWLPGVSSMWGRI